MTVANTNVFHVKWGSNRVCYIYMRVKRKSFPERERERERVCKTCKILAGPFQVYPAMRFGYS